MKKLDAEVEETLKEITDSYNSRVDRVTESYAEKWTKITNVSVDEAWKRLYSKVNKILQSPDLEDVNVIDVLMPFLSRIIKDRSAAHGMNIDLNLFAKWMATDGKYYYHWGLKKDPPAIEIATQASNLDPNAPLQVKERKPLLKWMTFKLNDMNVLELYEMVAPYLQSE